MSKGRCIIGISQSGEAADVIAVLEQAGQDGADTLAITNVANSPLTDVAQDTIILHAQAGTRGGGDENIHQLHGGAAHALRRPSGATGSCAMICSACRSSLPKCWPQEERIRARVERFRYLEQCVVLGRGYNLATAYELALKLRETSYVLAQPFCLAGLRPRPHRHARGRLSGDCLRQPRRRVALGDRCASRKPKRAAPKRWSSATRRKRCDIADIAIPVNDGRDVPEVISPFPSIVAGQIFAHALSLLKGYNPDHPRGLRKVTITR